MSPAVPSPTEDLRVLDDVACYFDDPLGFVRTCFPWGEVGGPLEHFTGPDEWQLQELEEIGQQVKDLGFGGVKPVTPIRRAIASGHGIGKSTLTSWLVLWLISTRPNCQGTVTANTYVQLETKTWAAIQKLHKLCLTAPWFICTTNRLYHPGTPSDPNSKQN
jgi:hypothetical protein